MGTDETIRSAQNAVLKRVRAARADREPDTVLLEGRRSIDDALAAGVELEVLLVDEARADASTEALGARRVAAGLLERVSALETSPGILALARRPEARPLADLDLGADGVALAVAGVSDPGNLGALARSAEAAGARALIVVRGGARPFGAKALRGSMGSLFRLPVHEADSVDAVRAAVDARHVAADASGASYLDFDFTGPLVLWVPGEVGDLHGQLRAFEGVSIPMAGEVESLNVTVAASILLFAAARGRTP